MATVRGVTAERADAIEAASVTGAMIQGKNLILTTHGGTQINVGQVIPDLYTNYPVGSLYFTDRSANPSSYLGGGTWVRWGKGRVPVSVDETQTEFDSVEKSGGAKSATLTIAQMPAHSHTGNTGNQSHDHSHNGYTYGGGGHEHAYLKPRTQGNVSGGGGLDVGDNVFDSVSTGGGGGHEHSVATYGASQNHYHGIPSDGGGAPHSILNPYITCYIWKRTA